MENNFNFDTIGKRMPYIVPEGFFDQMEEKILAEVRQEKEASARKSRALRFVMRTVMAAAACVAIAFTIQWGFRTSSQQVNAQDVEQAFSELSQTDQAYILAVYQDDIFMSE